MKINNLSSIITILNNKTSVQREIESQKLFDQKNEILKDPTGAISNKNIVVGMKDIREMLLNLNLQLTDLNIDIAKKMLKHRIPVNRENFAKVLKTLKQLEDSTGLSNIDSKNTRAIIKDLGSILSIFLLERNILPQPKVLDLMLRLMVRVAESEDLINFKGVLDSSTVSKNSFAYNYYPMNLELKDQTSLFLELFILPECHPAAQAEKEKRLVFCVDSKKLGLIKFDLGFAREKLDLKICVDREDLLGYVDQNISVLKAQLSSRGHRTAEVTCGLNKQSSFSYIESLLQLPQYQLDARV